jgi:hypothetical protein
MYKKRFEELGYKVKYVPFSFFTLYFVGKQKISLENYNDAAYYVKK